MKLLGLDIETESLDPEHPEYALQPWRVREGKARITHVAVCNEQRQSKEITLDEFESITEGSIIIAYNAIFDIAFLHAAGVNVGCRQWADAMHWWRWVDNGQAAERIPAWSLADAVERWFGHEVWAKQFIKMKQEEDRDDAYWAGRAKLDAFAGVAVARASWNCLNAQQRKSVVIEAACLVPIAKSWDQGILWDADNAIPKLPTITQEMEDLEYRLGCRTLATHWVPSPILRSSQKLGALLYDTWKLPVNKQHNTPKGKRSTSKDALTYLADQNDLVLEILRWRELNTQLTKFIQSPLKAAAYLSSCTLHPAPKLFSTYTGRMTYGSKIQKKYPIGMALHQQPRNKELRKLIKPPEGYYLVELDAAGQERRIITDLSQDPAMLDVFNRAAPNDDIHSFTGAHFAGISFEKFLELKAQGNKQVTGPKGYRYQGKFTNLSCQYRIGAPRFRIKTRVEYGMKIDYLTAKGFIKTHNRIYKGIVDYWETAIRIGKELGYAETYAGRRFALTEWEWEDRLWPTEQSAINFPVQGAGGDQKELALAMLTKKLPELPFGYDLHDGLFMYAKHEDLKEELFIEAKQILNNLPYEEAWGWKPSIPLPWDCSIGKDWGSMINV